MNDITPKFCSHCGSFLCTDLSNSFDVYTGQRELIEGCSNPKCLYSWRHRWYHDGFVVAGIGVIVFLCIVLAVKLFCKI